MFVATSFLPHIVAPLWTAPAACKQGKYKEVIGNILATPFLATGSFVAHMLSMSFVLDIFNL